MRSLAIFVCMFATLAAAAPHVLRDRTHDRHAHVAHFGSIAGRSESYDGSCGTWGGATCRAGFCCGSNGWCGNAEEHCGAGCQSGFGECGSKSSPEHGSPPPPDASGPPLYGPPSQPSVSGRPSYGPPPYGPHSSTTESPGQPLSPSSSATGASSSGQSGVETASTTYSTSTPESASSETSQSTSSVGSASPTSSTSSTSQYSDEPATSAPSSSSPASSSATPTGDTSSSSTYVSATPTPTSGGGGQSQGGQYITTFKGDGSESNGWPKQDQWLPFETLWEINQEIMNSSCSNAWALGSGTDNTDQELAQVKSAIEGISTKTGVDKSFIYVVMQQESLGCVRVRTTSNAHANPGLFQSNQGAGSCNDGGNLQIPCPQTEINQMVEDGVSGTSSGDGLEQLLGQATGEAAQKYYRAARMYNSGSLDASGSLGRAGATACYCSDIANRLLGWSQGTSKCTAAEVSN